MKNKWIKRKLRETANGYLFVWPYLLGFLAFFAYPLVFSIYISFGEFSIARGGYTVEMLGFKHYIDAFLYDISFTEALTGAIAETALKTPIIVAFSLIIAIMLNKNIPGRGIFRTICFLPFLLGTGEVMRQLLGMDVGSATLSVARGIMMPVYIQEAIGPTLVKLATTFFDNITLILWRSGVPIMLFISGLQSIPVALYEAAAMDGASEWELFWKVTLPMMQNVLLLTMIFTLIESFCDPSNPLVDMFYNRAFVQLDYSFSAAISWIYFIVVLIALLLVFAIMRRFRRSEYDV